MRISAPIPRALDRSGVRASKRFGRRWLLIPLVLIAITAIVVWRMRASATTTTATTTATVSQGPITAAVSGSGSVAAARTVTLSFQQSGTITAVDAKIGDQVKANQPLATIDAADLKLALEQAQANLKAAEASYAETKNGSATPQDLASAQAALDSAKAQLQQTKTSGTTDIQNARATLAAAQAKLDALKNPTGLTLSSAQSKVDQAQTALQSTQNSASQAKTNAQLALQNAVNALTQSQSKFSTAQQNWQHVQDTGTDPTNPTTTDSTGKKKANKLNDAQRQQYYDAFVQAQAALDSAQNAVTQAQVAYDAARQNEITQNTQAEATLKDAQATLAALTNPSASDLTQAQAAVTQAQATLDKLTQGGTAAAIAQSEASVTQAQANLDKLTAPAADAEVAAAQASLLQAQVAVDTAQRNLDQATLKAPFDGVVSAVDMQIGSSTSSTSSSGITLVDRSKLHIDVSLSEADAAKVAVGQPVTLTFDALSNVTLNGTVATVSPAATTSQNVVTYPIQIEFDPGQTPVKVGMSATATIESQKVDDAILVPSRAVQTAGGTKTVTLLQGAQQTPVSVTVTTGLTSNGQTQIVSSGGNGVPALKAGDVVSVPSTTATTSTSTQSNRSSTGLGGGFGGPPPGP
jgi:HlyD family secretion protein